MTPNWNAAVAALVGAAAGGAAGALVQGFRNKPMQSTALIAASLGAIVGAALTKSPSSGAVITVNGAAGGGTPDQNTSGGGG